MTTMTPIKAKLLSIDKESSMMRFRRKVHESSFPCASAVDSLEFLSNPIKDNCACMSLNENSVRSPSRSMNQVESYTMSALRAIRRVVMSVISNKPNWKKSYDAGPKFAIEN